MTEIKVGEAYTTHTHLLSIGGFKDDKELKLFCLRNNIEKDPRGYPIYRMISCLNEARRMKQKDLDLSEELLKEKVRKERVGTDIKMKIYVERTKAVERIRTTCQAVANKIRYSIKLVAPRIIGIMSVSDVESILTESYNSAIDQLITEADVIQSWEGYGYTTDFQPAGSEVVEDTKEDTINRGSQEDQSVNEDKSTREDRSFLNTLLGRSD